MQCIVDKERWTTLKRYTFIFVFVGIAIGIALGLLFARPTTDVHGSRADMHNMPGMNNIQASEPEAAQIAAPALKGQTRTYYIAADEVQWDYAPSGLNQITGEAFNDEANVFVQNGTDRIGSVYLKSQYREYTDNSFSTLKSISANGNIRESLDPSFRRKLAIPSMSYSKTIPIILPVCIRMACFIKRIVKAPSMTMEPTLVTRMMTRCLPVEQLRIFGKYLNGPGLGPWIQVPCFGCTMDTWM